MPRIRADIRPDADQSLRKCHLLICPTCGQKLCDVEFLHGTAIMRFKCRRCGMYVKADLVGVS